MTPERAGLLNAIADAAYGDDLPWLVYADWLDEQGDSAGAIIRQMWKTPYAHSLRNLRAEMYGPIRRLVNLPAREKLKYELGWVRWTTDPHDFLAWQALKLVSHWPVRITLLVQDIDEIALAEAIFQHHSRPGWRIQLDFGDDHTLWHLDMTRLSRIPGLRDLAVYFQNDSRHPPLPDLRSAALVYPQSDIFIDMILQQPDLEEIVIPNCAVHDSSYLVQLNLLTKLRRIELQTSTVISPDFIESWARSLDLHRLSIRMYCRYPSLLTDHLLTAICKHSGLRELTITATRSEIQNVHVLRSLKQLERFELEFIAEGNLRAVIEEIANLPSLSELNLRGCSALSDSDIFPLSKASQLVMLDLRECRRLTSGCIKPISQMRNLQGLDIQRCPNILLADVQFLHSTLPDCRILSDYPSKSSKRATDVD